MKVTYDPTLKAQVTRDEEGQVRQINHFDEYWDSNEFTPKQGAGGYVKEMSRLLNIREKELAHLQQPVSYWEPREQDVEYRLSEEKAMFDSTTVGYIQTALNVPIWGAGFTVTMKHNPNRIVACTFNGQDKVQASLPSPPAIDFFLKQFVAAERERALRAIPIPGEVAITDSEPASAAFIRELLEMKPPGRGRRKTRVPAAAAKRPDPIRLIRGRFFLYKYDPDERLPKHPEPMPETLGHEQGHAQTLALPRVPDSINPGQYYLVGEITFEFGGLVWLALVEVETRTILYLRALASGVNGMVFTLDPISSSGSGANTPDQNNATLNPFRSSHLLPNLNAPVGGTQSLTGTRASVMNVEDPNIAPPTEPMATDFNFDVRTNNFAAVSAYYHVDKLFQVIEDLGFPLATYFDGTTFPVPADHRDFPPDGLTINAHCIGNGTGGIGHVGYALNDLSDTANPVGRAADSRVTWHELGGHGILYDHVNSANFGFCHSAGDSLSIILHDPISNAPDRFRYAPWNPINLRRADRDVTAGWAWGGFQDDAAYGSEEILETTLFRAYRSIGGDSADMNRRRFASRVMMYLILRAVGTLTPGTNPGNALAFANTLMAVDLLNWTSEGVDGGAYNKVLRWSFEKQGLFQPSGAPTPVATSGAPPAVDVYIDDGRGGEYPFQPVHWANVSVWNRRSADGLPGHQEPTLGTTNYVYVNVKNRGTETANNVRVKGFHTRPAAGLVWPADFEALTTAEIVLGTILGNNAEQKTAGPFDWIPNINAYGHDCLLMVASADSDPSNIDNFTSGESIPEWRLVPNDNNIGQRNVFPVPGGGGGEGLIAGLDGISLWVGNPHNRRAEMEVQVQLPAILSGWRLGFQDVEGKFVLGPGKKRELKVQLLRGREFDRTMVEASADREITVRVYASGILVGGMTYYLDPALRKPHNPRPGRGKGAECVEVARELLTCLNLPAADVKSVRVKKVVLDVQLFGDGQCD